MNNICTNNLESLYPLRGRILCVDFGEKRVGVAVSDETQTVATPLKVLVVKSQDQLSADLISCANEFNACALVFGWPLNMNGTQSNLCEKIHTFADSFSKQFQSVIAFWDERLSSRASEQVLIDSDMSRKKRKGIIDKVAAAYILQGLLDFLKGRRNLNEVEFNG